MNFKKIDIHAKKNPRHDPQYPQAKDIKMVRVSATFPMLKSCSSDDIIEEFNNIGFDLSPKKVSVEESDVTASDLKNWMESTGFDYWSFFEDNNEYELSTVLRCIDSNSKKTKKGKK